jgi:hypothetical protein
MYIGRKVHMYKIIKVEAQAGGVLIRIQKEDSYPIDLRLSPDKANDVANHLMIQAMFAEWQKDDPYGQEGK